jgi:hypothetical protein
MTADLLFNHKEQKVHQSASRPSRTMAIISPQQYNGHEEKAGHIPHVRRDHRCLLAA